MSRTSEIDAENLEDPLLGREIAGRYRIIERVAAGGMGVVYRAEQVALGRIIALKVLQAPNAQVAERFRKRFLLEAETVSKLSHPNTVVVHDYGQFEDDVFMAMEFLEGKTLSEHLVAHGPMSPPEAVHVAVQIASCLGEAHRQGLVHRDLKPGNVMLTHRGGDTRFAKVLDFGLVKIVRGADKDMELTQSGVMLGSPRYMAPEQVRGGDIDGRADIYAFGTVLFALLVGTPPFGGESKFDVMRAHVYEAPPSFADVWPGCPADRTIESIVMRCLEKDADNRFQSMDELVEALLAWREHYVQNGNYESQGSGSAPIFNAPQSSRVVSWLPIAIGAGCLLVSATLVALYLAIFSGDTEQPQAALPAPTVEHPVAAPPTPTKATTSTLKTNHAIEVTSTPNNAKVSNGAERLGRTPLTLESIAKGTVLTLRARGYETRRFTVTDATSSFHINLKRDSQKSASEPAADVAATKPAASPVKKPKPTRENTHPDLHDPWD